MKKRKRKFPCTSYTINAPFAQKNYNQFKCGVDKWNKAILEYYRLGRFIDADVMQLQFRKRLLQELKEFLEPEPAVQPLAKENIHWPMHMSQQKHRCQYPPCRNNCAYYCAACNKWGCMACLQKAHVNE